MTAEVQQAPNPYAWQPQPGRQAHACAAAAFCDELFYGGATFGGKTDFLLGDFAADTWQGSAWVGVLFRKTYPELEELIERSHEIYLPMGAEYRMGRRTWIWPSGAMLRLRSLDNPLDYTKNRGFSYAWQGWDELPEWPDLTAYHKMKAWLRGPAQNKRIRASGNPGGPGHQAVKEYFGLDAWPEGYKLIVDKDTETTRMFIPSRATDNHIGMAGDPNYIKRLQGIGDPELVRAWMDGDWNAVIGGYFSQFRPEDLLVEPFEIPANWQIFTGGDYGENNPTWWGIVAVDSDDDLWVIDEYYRGGDVAGMDHARSAAQMVKNCPFIFGRSPSLNLAPGDMWIKRQPGEASLATSAKDSFAAAGLHLTKANMDRIGGWRNLKDLLYHNRIRFFRGRTERIVSSLSTVQRDPKHPEDVLKQGDDHPADGLRYIVNHTYKARQLPTPEANEPFAGAQVLKALESMGRDSERYTRK